MKSIGLKKISSRNKDKVIIFVHGLNGDAVETWKKKNDKPLPDLLDEEEELKDFEVYTYGYRTGFLLKQYNINQIAELLMTEVMDVFRGKDLYFIGHSQGGLVIQKMIINLVDKEKKEYTEKIKGIIYLAVPFEGAVGGTVISVIGSFVPPVLGKCIFSVQVLSLRIFHKDLRELRERWNTSIRLKKFPNLIEKVIVGQADLTVNPFSSKPPYIDDVGIVEANHRTICKVDRNHRVYSLITNFLKSNIKNGTENPDVSNLDKKPQENGLSASDIAVLDKLFDIFSGNIMYNFFENLADTRSVYIKQVIHFDEAIKLFLSPHNKLRNQTLEKAKVEFLTVFEELLSYSSSFNSNNGVTARFKINSDEEEVKYLVIVKKTYKQWSDFWEVVAKEAPNYQIKD
ncbi:putative lipase [Peribacillus frigoritolerans]|uniref:esterase/lipase family protein n=1 Tax=Peribacillus frigoritolerans TaxID=450367 RepID=UPI002079FA33|nr:putative lipase [Peribacillus frigoritolerans]USK82623.1 putative lipase [Peribacillus frigoritolerans]